MFRFCLILFLTALFPITTSSEEIHQVSLESHILSLQNSLTAQTVAISKYKNLKRLDVNYPLSSEVEIFEVCKLSDKPKEQLQIIKNKIVKKNYKIIANDEQIKKIENILSQIPEKYKKSLEKIKITKNIQRRWLAWAKSMYLNPDMIDSNEEFERVFIHEFWHIVDLWYLKSKEEKITTKFKDWTNDIFADDPSVEFYLLCWETESKQNWECNDLDFASKYWQADVFEDFAESFLLYVKNNASFKIMATESEIMKKKYEFFKKYLWEWKTWIYENQNAFDRVYDLTMEF